MKRSVHCAVMVAATLLGVSLATGARAEITYTNEFGGKGGGHFEDNCNPGDFLIGFNWTAGKALNTVSPLCVVQKKGKWAGQPYHRRTWGQPAENIGGLTTPFMNGTHQCNPDQFVTALHVWWDKFGIVHHVQVFCHNVSRTKKVVYQTDNQGGEPSHDGSAPCPTGQFGIGLHGGYGALIDRIGLKCQTLAP